MSRRRKGAPPQLAEREPGQWWIETTPAAIGWRAIAKSSNGWRLGSSIDGMGNFPIWRLTERWARRSIERGLRRWERQRRREAAREDRTRVHPVEL